jgi:hypothetical protein
MLNGGCNLDYAYGAVAVRLVAVRLVAVHS